MLIVEVEAPGATLYGFEHKASSAEEQQKQAAAIEKLKANMATMLGLPAELGCQLKDQNIETKHTEAGHSETLASFSFQCEKSLDGATLNIDME